MDFFEGLGKWYQKLDLSSNSKGFSYFCHPNNLIFLSIKYLALQTKPIQEVIN